MTPPPALANPLSARRLAAVFVYLMALAALLSLGSWQMQRRVWKHDLIAQVQANIKADPIDAPTPASWAMQDGPALAYRHVRAHGQFIGGHTIWVEASTSLGAGYWLLQPLRTTEGFTILINRGFVPKDKRDETSAAQPTMTTNLTGLLRISEPHGMPLRPNRPAENRWFSRDVDAIARQEKLPDAAPYFIDADANTGAGWPHGGMTVVNFPDNHLVYALTWFGLAALLAAWPLWSAKYPRAKGQYEKD